MKFRTVLCAIPITLIMAVSAHGSAVPEFTKACEIELALSAAPTYVREKAGVYVLGESGYEKVRDSENGFMCMVPRNGPDVIVPQCFDKIGQETHVRVHLDEGKKIREGKTRQEIRQDRALGFFNGTYSTAKGHGVVYMASDYNFAVTPRGKNKIAPHVMYHAPGVTNADIGSVPPEAFKNPGMPFVAGTGPMGFMISFTERATDSSGVIANCTGQIGDKSEFKPFPPK